jgi:hypothetical protein
MLLIVLIDIVHVIVDFGGHPGQNFFIGFSWLIDRSEDGLSIDMNFIMVRDHFDTSEAT